jgi:hypothetical protein
VSSLELTRLSTVHKLLKNERTFRLFIRHKSIGSNAVIKGVVTYGEKRGVNDVNQGKRGQ